MDDKSLHDLLTGALAGEPPIGPVAQNSLRAGIRLRRRRRALAAAGCAAVAVIAVIIQTGTGLIGHSPGPAGLENRGQYLRFQLAFNRFHDLPPTGVPPGVLPALWPKNEASRRRARNNIGFREAGRRPSTLAISR